MKTKLPIQPKYAYLAALVLTLLMVLQSSDMEGGQITLHFNRVLLFACNYLTWALGLGLIHRFTVPYELSAQTWRKDLFKLIGIGLLISGIQLLVSNVLYYIVLALVADSSLDEMLSGFSNVLIRAYASRVLDFLVILGILKALDNYRKLHLQKLTMASLQASLSETRLEALKMQLNPHFLFNSLHAIHAMIGYDNEKARSILLKVSQLLRKILELGDQQLIPLNEELNYLKDYLDIEQERFHDRLQVTYTIDESTLHALVPSLLLQPLAENALKHGISLLEGSGIVAIEVIQQAPKLTLRVTNTVTPEPVVRDHSMGIGLANLQNRLTELYAKEFSMQTNRTEEEYTVTIDIPLEYED